MKTFHTQDAFEFLKYFETTDPELFSKFPNKSFTVMNYDIMVPVGVFNYDEDKRFRKILKDWQTENGFFAN